MSQREPVDWERFERVMALVKRELGQSATPLAVNSGLSAERPNAPRTVTNWLNHVNAPEFEPTMMLLSAAGLLTPEADAAWRGELGEAVAEMEQKTPVLPRPGQPGQAPAASKRERR